MSECRFVSGICEAHGDVCSAPQCGVRHGSPPALCTHAAAALQGRALDFEEMYARTKLERDEAEARVRELDQVYVNAVQVEIDLKWCLVQREQEMQQHVMTHAEVLSQLGDRIAHLDREKAEAVHARVQAENSLNEERKQSILRHTRAEQAVGRLREALQVIEKLRKRLPDPDFAEQETTARAIGETVHAALAEAEGEGSATMGSP